MKISVTFDLSKSAREALSHNHGYQKPATYKQCKSFIHSEMMNVFEDMVFGFDQYEEEQRQKENENE